MLAGHIAVGMLAKRVEPAISLGTAVLAAVLADLLAFIFLIAGIEHFDAIPGVALNRTLGRDIVFSHSLLMDALWAGVFAGIYCLRRRNRNAAWILSAAVLSHWFLDVVSHRPDMPLAPGIHKVFGLGLWNSTPATLIVEGGMWILAIVLYIRATYPQRLAGVYFFWIGIALFTLVWRANIAAGIDPNPVRSGVGGLIFFSLIVGWAYWINRLRSSRGSRRRDGTAY